VLWEGAVPGVEDIARGILVNPASATALTVIVGWIATLYFARTAAGLPPLKVAATMVLLSAFAYAGARIHYLLTNPVEATPWTVLTGSGAHAAGGMIGLILGLLVIPRRFGLPLRVMADVSALATGLALATYRVGCLLRGCCFGIRSDLPWAIRYPRQSIAFMVHADARLIPYDAEWSAPVHPLPLYFATVAIAITVVARWRYPHRRYDGQIALLSLALFSLSTLGLEFLRAPIRGQTWWGPLPQLVWIALTLSVASVLLLVVCEPLQRRSLADGRPAAHR
jgi:phosphatidylglycerol:prolipoprotein diacylglycerol transferase